MLKIVAVRDQKTEAFGRPVFVQTEGIAIRSFDDEVNNSEANNIMNQHPEDFSLYCLGEFNEFDGSFETHIPKLLVQGTQVAKVVKGQVSAV